MTDLKIEQQKGSKVQIAGELPWEDFKNFRNKAVAKVGELVSIDGFRKGKIPEDVLVKHVGEHTILEEMASLAFQKMYPEILREHKIDAIGRPEIQITKLAKDNPLGFTIVTAVMPEVKLPDYKAIAKEVNTSKEKTEVLDKDVEEAIEQIRTMRAKQDLFKKMQDGTAPASDVENNKDETPEEVQKRIDEKLELPEFNEEFVKTLGDFKDVEDFKTKLRENLAVEKERKADDKNRIDIINAILEKTNVELPELVVDAELDQLIYRMKSDVESMGMKFEEYLTNLKKTEEEIRREARPDAEKRAKIQILVGKIAQQEQVTPSQEKVEHELKHLKEQYPDVQDAVARNYIENILINDEVFKMLQKQ